MAYWDFTIQECLMFRRAEFAIPAFTKGKDQLDPVDVSEPMALQMSEYMHKGPLNCF